MARICMIAYSKYASDARIRREAEALTARGDEVDLICLPDEMLGTGNELNGVRLHPVNIKQYRGSKVWRYVLSYARFFCRSFLLVTMRHLRCRYDVIQVHTMPDLLVFAALVPRLMGARIILDIHDLMPELYMSKFNLSWDHWLIRALVCMEKISIAFAHRAIAVHQTHLEALAMHGNPVRKFEVLMNTPDPAVFFRRSRERQSKCFKLVYHGTISKRHGLELAILAAAIARSDVANLKLSIIGDGDDLQRLVDLVGNLKLERVVNFEKGVPVNELPALLEDADLGIIPLKQDIFTQYMLPVKLMEYVALGIPVIVTRTKTITRYFDEDMVEYIGSESENEIAQRIVQLYRDPQRRVRMTIKADEFARRNNWKSQKLEYYNLVDSLVGAT